MQPFAAMAKSLRMARYQAVTLKLV